MGKLNGILLAGNTTDMVTAESIADAEREVNAAWNLFQQRIPDLLAFGVRVVLCFLFFLIGPFCDQMDPESGQTFPGPCKYRSGSAAVY